MAVVLCAAAAYGQTPSPEECQPPKMKVCVVEPKKNTRTVYGSVCKEYCLPRCSIWDVIRGWCGGCAGCAECGPVRSRNVLVKKTVPACDTKQCVIKEVEGCPNLPR